ncbi:hypothetical protein HDV00_008090 [Rhizophlyctis rosea]|nr:hypothetical protein HDV00_008090 [Rhizophlyctis rosea]
MSYKPGPTPGYTGRIPATSSYLPDVVPQNTSASHEQESSTAQSFSSSAGSGPAYGGISERAASGGTGDYYTPAGQPERNPHAQGLGAGQGRHQGQRATSGGTGDYLDPGQQSEVDFAM